MVDPSPETVAKRKEAVRIFNELQQTYEDKDIRAIAAMLMLLAKEEGMAGRHLVREAD